MNFDSAVSAAKRGERVACNVDQGCVAEISIPDRVPVVYIRTSEGKLVWEKYATRYESLRGPFILPDEGWEKIDEVL